jgi:hypothetical protein
MLSCVCHGQADGRDTYSKVQGHGPTFVCVVWRGRDQDGETDEMVGTDSDILC